MSHPSILYMYIYVSNMNQTARASFCLPIWKVLIYLNQKERGKNAGATLNIIIFYWTN